MGVAGASVEERPREQEAGGEAQPVTEHDEHEHGLEIGQDIAFQRRMWRFQRAGWVAMVVVALLALIGLFGSGPLSRAREGTAGTGLTLDYARLTRHGAPDNLRVHLPASSTSQGKVELAVDREYLEGLRLEGIVPEPESTEGRPDAMVYVFQVQPGAPTTLTFEFTPEALGLRAGSVRLKGREPVSFTQLVYP